MSNEAEIFGWCGRILKVDLSTSSIGDLRTMDYADRFLGGRGVAAKIYWDEVKPETKAFEPENCLVFMTGPMGAVGAQGASRFEVVGKSPMLSPEGFCFGSLGGYFGPFLKKAGFDGVVVTGAARRPCYLLVNDGQVQILDGADLWGRSFSQVRSSLKETYGDDVRFVTTGIAGENRCRAATVMTDQDGSATGGFGAVMGSKNLKAIAVLGTGAPAVARREEFNSLNRLTTRLAMDRGDVSRVLYPAMNELEVKGSRKANCYQCGLGCMRRMFRLAPDKEVMGKCQPIGFYSPWVNRRDGEPLATSLTAKEICNEYSICSLETQYILEWLEHCYQSGIMTGEEIGLDFTKIGSADFIESLVAMIAKREGMGEVLAEGLLRIEDKFDQRALGHFSEKYPGIGFGYEMPKEYPLGALIFATQPRVTPAMMKEINLLIAYWMMNRDFPDTSPMDNDLFRKVAERFWGNGEAWDYTTYAGKAEAVKRMQDRNFANDSLVMCSVAWPLMISDNTPDHIGDPALESKLFSAVTGVDTDEAGLHEYGERVFNLQRAILLREGWRAKDSDQPEEFNFANPVVESTENPQMIVPGPVEETQSFKGNVLDRKKFEAMRAEYYQIRGWDPDTGLQKSETLERLKMGDIAAELRASGLVF